MNLDIVSNGYLQPWANKYFISSVFAASEFGLNSIQFHRIVNAKAGTCRRTMHKKFPEYAVPKGRPFTKGTTTSTADDTD